MKLPGFLRINKGDYPEEVKPTIDKLASSLNPGIESLFNLGNNRISLNDNINCVVRDITVIVDANGFPTASTGIALGSIVQTAMGSQVIDYVNNTNSNVYVTANPMIKFTQNGSTFEVNHIAGLPANNQFTLTVIVWGA